MLCLLYLSSLNWNQGSAIHSFSNYLQSILFLCWVLSLVLGQIINTTESFHSFCLHEAHMGLGDTDKKSISSSAVR